MEDELVIQAVELPGGELRVRQPEEAAELPDDGAVEWAPLAPYWAVLWRSGVELAGELEAMELRGRRVVELAAGSHCRASLRRARARRCLRPTWTPRRSSWSRGTRVGTTSGSRRRWSTGPIRTD